MSKQLFVIGLTILGSLIGLYFYKSAAFITLSCTTAITLAMFNGSPAPRVETAVVIKMKPVQLNP